MNKVTLIIPDIHLKWEMVDKIIAAVKHDEIIFLGDFFDDFNDTPGMVASMCDWLEASVKHENRIHLFGNHDVHYAFPYKKMKCSGYDQWKYFMIYDRLPRHVWDKFKWYHFLDNTFLLTHAGLHVGNLPSEIRKTYEDRPKFYKLIANYLDEETIRCIRETADGRSSWMFNAGAYRGGERDIGGIIWCDHIHEFKPIRGLHQIYGHTPSTTGNASWININEKNHHSNMIYADKWQPKGFGDVKTSFNLDLDVAFNMHYATWDGETLKVDAFGGKDLYL